MDTTIQSDETIPHAWVGEPDSGIRLPWTFALPLDLVDDDEDEADKLWCCSKLRNLRRILGRVMCWDYRPQSRAFFQWANQTWSGMMVFHWAIHTVLHLEEQDDMLPQLTGRMNETMMPFFLILMILMTRFHDEATDLARFHGLKNCQSGLLTQGALPLFTVCILPYIGTRVVISYCQFSRCQCPRRCFFPPEA